MENKLANFLKYLQKLKDNSFTGQIRINFHKGSIASKIEKKVAITENDIAWTNASRTDTFKETETWLADNGFSSVQIEMVKRKVKELSNE